jgi:hypothetical protein
MNVVTADMVRNIQWRNVQKKGLSRRRFACIECASNMPAIVSEQDRSHCRTQKVESKGERQSVYASEPKLRGGSRVAGLVWG